MHRRLGFKLYCAMKKLFALTLAITTILLAAQTASTKAQFHSTAASSEAELYRFYSISRGKHFYTVDHNEIQKLINHDPNWEFESIAFNVFDTCEDDRIPIYRFYNFNYESHFYTASESEKQKLVDHDPNWNYEGIAFCAYESLVGNTLPVYRFHSIYYDSHFYTMKVSEKDKLIFNDDNWQYEGVAYYAFSDQYDYQVHEVADNCPITTQSCVPCTPGTQYCRTAAGDPYGFKGWACQNNNPGNIRYSSYRNNIIENNGGTAACGERGSFSVFSDYATGKNSLEAYIRGIANGEHVAYPECGNCSLRYFFSKYAPSNDNNNPDAYAQSVADDMGNGVDTDTTTLSWIVDNMLHEMANAIQVHEGWFVQ